MNADAVSRAVAVLTRRVGLRMDPGLRGRLERCLHEAAGSEDVGDYIGRLETDPAALQALLNTLTVQHTSFFRDHHQFEVLARDVVPALAAPVTIWSAGCANGQEAYSLAFTLAESAACTDWRVIASDISTDALRRTRAARYSQREIEGVSPARLARFMHRAGDGWEVDTEIRGRVDVVHHNLAGGPMPAAAGQCQVVFCRNVLIYFNLADSVKFLDRLAEWLPVGGYLFLGYSESLWQVTDRFTLEHLRNAFVYRRPGGKRVPPPVIPAAPETRVASDGGHPTSMAAAPEYGSAPDDDVPSVALLHSEGEAALSAGDHRTAIAAFRKVIYLDPDDFTAGLHLGFALEAAGHFRDAQRAYRACRAALDRSEVAAIEAALEGYSHEQLLELLDRKIRHLAAM